MTVTAFSLRRLSVIRRILRLTTAVSSRGCHWKGVAGFGMNWLMLSVRRRNPFFPVRRTAGPVLHPLDQPDDGLDILVRLRREADHEVEPQTAPYHIPGDCPLRRRSPLR